MQTLTHCVSQWWMDKNMCFSVWFLSMCVTVILFLLLINMVLLSRFTPGLIHSLGSATDVSSGIWNSFRSLFCIHARTFTAPQFRLFGCVCVCVFLLLSSEFCCRNALKFNKFSFGWFVCLFYVFFWQEKEMKRFWKHQKNSLHIWAQANKKVNTHARTHKTRKCDGNEHAHAGAESETQQAKKLWVVLFFVMYVCARVWIQFRNRWTTSDVEPSQTKPRT